MSDTPEVKAFYYEHTSAFTYVVWDPSTKDAVVIDPVLDFDPRAVRVSETSLDAVEQFVTEHALTVHWTLDTHPHADHFSGTGALRRRWGVPMAIGANIVKVQQVFCEILGITDIPTDGSQWDALLEDEGTLDAGSLTLRALQTSGHTPACMAYHIGNTLFAGDAIFMPDFGTGRCDFPLGSADDLWTSIQRLYALPRETRVFVGHDYQPNGRELRFETSIEELRTTNIQLRHDTPKQEFTTFRTQRDAKLSPPGLMYQSLQVNIRGGELPAPNDNGVSYLRLPLS